MLGRSTWTLFLANGENKVLKMKCNLDFSSRVQMNSYGNVQRKNMRMKR